MDTVILSRLKARLKLLTPSNAKIVKGMSKGYVTVGLHLAPADLSGYNTCPAATSECKAMCLNLSGMGYYPAVQNARIAKTRRFFEDRKGFVSALTKEIGVAGEVIAEAGYIPAFRLNLTSDIRWELHGVPQQFPNLTFYDYTKLTNRKDVPANYHLTFSFSGHNLEACKLALANGMSVAVPFRVAPTTWLGYPVVDGDEDDLRFLGDGPRIVALKPKGRLRNEPTSVFLGDNHAG